MKLLVMNQSIPKLARSAVPALALEKLAKKEPFLRSQPKVDYPLKGLPKNADDFLRLAQLEYPTPVFAAQSSSLVPGDACLIGGLAVAALAAEDLASSFRHPLYPWRRHVDILLIGGTLKKDDLHHQLNAAVLPSLIFFSGGGESSVEQIRKPPETRRIIDLGGGKNRFYEIEYDPTAKSDTLTLIPYRLGLLGRRQQPGEAFALQKYTKILSFLREYHMPAVTEKLESHFAQETKDGERTEGAWLAAEDAVIAASEYLSFLDRHSDASEKQKKEMLERILKEKLSPSADSLPPLYERSERINAEVGKIIRNRMKAFTLYLEAWGLREERESPLPFGAYR
jgi:hypothetical protein